MQNTVNNTIVTECIQQYSIDFNDIFSTLSLCSFFSSFLHFQSFFFVLSVLLHCFVMEPSYNRFGVSSSPHIYTKRVSSLSQICFRFFLLWTSSISLLHSFLTIFLNLFQRFGLSWNCRNGTNHQQKVDRMTNRPVFSLIY